MFDELQEKRDHLELDNGRTCGYLLFLIVESFKMKRLDVMLSWTIMVTALAVMGRVDEAREVF